MPEVRQRRNSGGYVAQHLPQGRIYFHINIREVSLKVLRHFCNWRSIGQTFYSVAYKPHC